MITSTIITIIGLIGSLITIYREIYPKDKRDGSLREPSPDTERTGILIVKVKPLTRSPMANPDLKMPDRREGATLNFGVVCWFS